jgi:hypothetical protein
MKQEIIDYLTQHGEQVTSKIHLSQFKRENLVSCMMRMAAKGILERRPSIENGKHIWMYSVVDKKGSYRFGEPDYAYFLRNLGRNNERESVASHCGDLDCSQETAGDQCGGEPGQGDFRRPVSSRGDSVLGNVGAAA